MAKRDPISQSIARKAGLSWEKTLDAIHEKYEASGKAVVFHCPPDYRILRRKANGTFIGAFVKGGPPDYVCATDEFTFLVEAKTRDAKSLSWNLIPEHQAARMTAWDRISPQHVSALLINLRATDCFGWVVPWLDVVQRWETFQNQEGRARKGTGSLNVKHLDSLGVRFGPNGWVDPLLSLLKRP